MKFSLKNLLNKFKRDPLKKEIKEAIGEARRVCDLYNLVHLGDYDIYELAIIYQDILNRNKVLSKRGKDKYELLIVDLQNFSENALSSILEVADSGKYNKRMKKRWEAVN